MLSIGVYDNMTAADIDERIGQLRRMGHLITLADAHELQELEFARRQIRSALRGRRRYWSPFGGL